ncbi:hypothetical protein [Roseibacillus persicicus]|uniref:hypothetical protein n=1 Tax=Roseibacillus persicicus TaxID=454148 RepID=UPI00280FFA65|nr:hypothetical protein [Roseibacillus persicicus]MDQ8192754.1 hypothetical protein [Roseibacillus persicicus]
MKSAFHSPLTVLLAIVLSSCSIQIGVQCEEDDDTLDAIAVSFSDGSRGKVEFVSERGSWKGRVPSTIYVPKGSDKLTFIAIVDDKRRSASGYVTSRIIPEIARKKGFSGFEGKDAIADRYWSYPSTLVIEVPPSPVRD